MRMQIFQYFATILNHASLSDLDKNPPLLSFPFPSPPFSDPSPPSINVPSPSLPFPFHRTPFLRFPSLYYPSSILPLPVPLPSSSFSTPPPLPHQGTNRVSSIVIQVVPILPEKREHSCVHYGSEQPDVAAPYRIPASLEVSERVS